MGEKEKAIPPNHATKIVKPDETFGIGTDIAVGVVSGIAGNLGSDAVKAGLKVAADRIKGSGDKK